MIVRDGHIWCNNRSLLGLSCLVAGVSMHSCSSWGHTPRGPWGVRFCSWCLGNWDVIVSVILCQKAKVRPVLFVVIRVVCYEFLCVHLVQAVHLDGLLQGVAEEEHLHLQCTQGTTDDTSEHHILFVCYDGTDSHLDNFIMSHTFLASIRLKRYGLCWNILGS